MAFFIFYGFINPNCTKYSGKIVTSEEKFNVVCNVETETCESTDNLSKEAILEMELLGFKYNGIISKSKQRKEIRKDICNEIQRLTGFELMNSKHPDCVLRMILRCNPYIYMVAKKVYKSKKKLTKKQIIKYYEQIRSQ